VRSVHARAPIAASFAVVKTFLEFLGFDLFAWFMFFAWFRVDIYELIFL
jgi:hypothetical protein